MAPIVQRDHSGTLTGSVLQPTHLPIYGVGCLGHKRVSFETQFSHLESGENVFFQACRS